MSQIYERAITQAMEQIAERDARIERLRREVRLRRGLSPPTLHVRHHELRQAVDDVDRHNDMGGEE